MWTLKTFPLIAAAAVALLLTACGLGGGFGGDPRIADAINPVQPDGGCDIVGTEFNHDVAVPEGVSCTFTRVTVVGNLYLTADASLEAADIFVDGSVLGQGAAAATVVDSWIVGDIQLEQGGSADIGGTRIDGNLHFEDNHKSLEAAQNIIGGHLQAFQNTGGVAVSDNTIGGNLQCNANDPAPTGGGNVVAGNKEDQCSAL